MAQRLKSLSQLPSRGEAQKQRRHETVSLSNGMDVEVFALSGTDVKRWNKENVTIRGTKIVKFNNDTATERLLARALRDEETGQPLFNPQDVVELMDLLDGSDIARIEKVARRLSGIDDLDDDEDAVRDSDSDDLDDEEDEDGSSRGSAEGNDGASIPRTLSPTG